MLVASRHGGRHPLSALESQVSSADRARLAALEEAVAAEDAEVERLTAEAAGLTARAAALAEALAVVGGPKLRKQREAVQRLQEASCPRSSGRPPRRSRHQSQPLRMVATISTSSRAF